jgi:hypothetical protein
VDHLSTLPPELIGVIYDNFASDAKHHFLAIVRSLLPSQRMNLYRQVVIRSKLAFAKFCWTLSGTSGIELGGMVVDFTICDSMWDEEEDDNMNIDPARIEAEEIMMDALVQSILPKLTRLNILKVNTLPAARPIIPFFSSPTYLPGTSSIVTLQLRLEDYSQLHLILPLFPNLLDLSLELPTSPSVLGIEYTAAPDAPSNSTLQLRHLNRLFIRGNFTVPSVCQIVASTEAKSTILWGVAVHNGLRVLRNSERMESLNIRCNHGDEASQDHGRALVKFTRVKELSLGRQIDVEPTFFTDLFKSNPGLKILTLAEDFPLVASDLISAIKSNPIVGMRLGLNFVGLVPHDDMDEDDMELYHVDWPDGCEAEDVQAIMAWGALERMDVTGSAVDIIDRLHERDFEEWYENRNPSEDDYEGDEEEEEY